MDQRLKTLILIKNKKYLNFLLILILSIINYDQIVCMAARKNFEYENELTQSVNIQRIEQLNKMCQTMEFNSTIADLTFDQMEHMLIDRTHKFMYCYAPKVACTNWKRVLMMMTGQWTNGTDALQIPATLAHSPGMFVKFSELNSDEKQEVVSNYTKFIIVRHPFERLLSAYRNKLEGTLPSSKYFQARIGRYIIRNFRPNPSNESLLNGHDVTFTEFVQYLLSPEVSNNKTFNEHWAPITDLCNPCAIKYNIIGKYETLIDDSTLALHVVGADNITFPVGQKTSGTFELMEKYFDPFPIKVTQHVYKLYENDFKLFGYTLEDVFGLELA